MREIENADWTLAAESFALPCQYFLVVHPPMKGVERPRFLDEGDKQFEQGPVVADAC